MVLTTKQENILKADFKIRFAQQKLRQKSRLVQQELAAQFAPIEATIKAAHVAEVETLQTKLNTAQAELKLLLED